MGLLILARRKDQAIKITVPAGRARTIHVYVTDVDRGKVRLGFRADDDIVIDRTEIAELKAATWARMLETAIATGKAAGQTAGGPTP